MSRKRHEMEKECRAKGGRVGMVASGNPDVLEEAHEKHAKGGKVKKHKKHHEMHAEGHKSHHRMDRPKRARGGKVGSDKNPFSSAHHSGKTGETYGGEPD